MNYELLTTENAPVKMWTKGVPVEADARQQLINTAKMPFIFKHIAVMPDVHLGKGSTIGSVIPTKGAIIPAAVGVDIGCGMNALRTALTAEDLPENLAELRQAIETAVPHGRTTGRCKRDKGAWENPPVNVDANQSRSAPVPAIHVASGGWCGSVQVLQDDLADVQRNSHRNGRIYADDVD